MPIEAVNAGRSVVIGVNELAEEATFQNEAAAKSIDDSSLENRGDLVSKQVNRSERFARSSERKKARQEAALRIDDF